MRIALALTCVLALLLSSYVVTTMPGTGIKVYVPATMAIVNVDLTYPNGSPAEGMDIMIYRYDWSYPYTPSYDITDIDGKASVEVRSSELGPCYVAAMNGTLGRFVRTPLYIEPGETYNLDMVLNEGLPYDYTVQGTVRDSTTSTPLGEAYIQIYGSDADGREISVNFETKANGKYSIPLPYSIRGYWIDISHSEHSSFNSMVYFNRTQMTYDLDVILQPYQAGVPLSIHFIDDSSGAGIPISTASIRGLAAYDDHLPYYYWYWGLNSEWLNSAAGKGEYTIGFSFNQMNGSLNTYYSGRFGILMEDSPLDLEERIPVPTEFRELKMKVVEEGTQLPIGLAYIYNEEFADIGDDLYDLHCQISTQTNLTGFATIPLVPDTTYYFHVGAGQYKRRTIEIPAGPLSEDLEMTVELKYNPYVPPAKGNISILAIDQPTGEVLQEFYIQGEGDGVSFYEATNQHGYLNTSVPAGIYDRISISGNLGEGVVEDFELGPGETRSLTLYLNDRRQFHPDTYTETTFRIVDEDGAPIPGMYVPIIQWTNEFSYEEYPAFSDPNGYVRFSGEPGNYEILKEQTWYDYINGKRMHFVPAEGASFTVPAEEGVVPDIVYYSSYPLTDVSGVVRNLASGEAIANADLYYESGRGLDDDDTLKVKYLKHQTLSTFAGTYRMWGKDMISYTCTYPGFFPQKDIVYMDTRAITEDIYLEELIPYTTTIDGTIVNYLNVSISGGLSVYDLERDRYLVNYTDTEGDGTFSIGVYPGHFEIEYYNETTTDRIELTVGEDGVEGLYLYLIPESYINGTVMDMLGSPVEGIPVDLLYGPEEDVYGSVVTDADGRFSFLVPPDIYSLMVLSSELFLEKYEGPFVTDGFNDIDLSIHLENRTSGLIRGHIIGNMIVPEKIENATVILKDSSSTTISTTVSGAEGYYYFANVQYADGYMLHVDPPNGTAYEPAFFRSGYRPRDFGPFDFWLPDLMVNVNLEYEVSTPPGYFNVTSAYPSGPEVYLNEPIIIEFSEPVDDDNILGFITFDPALTITSSERSDENMTLFIQHEEFLPNTTYTVTISADLISAPGNKLWEGPYVWNFTTGSDIQSWMIDGKDVSVGADRTVTIQATGELDMMVYFVVKDIGSYLLTEGPAGMYKGTIAGTLLEWDTTYSYHFSDADGGADNAPSFAGTFKTPVKPIVWRLDTATVEIDDDGNWVVTADGEPGIEVWIVIEGVGSFKMIEGTPGHYTVTIPDGRFDEGEEYDYWFSDASGGPDKAPTISGKMKAKGGDGGDYGWLVFCCLAGFVAVVLLILVMIFALVLRRGKNEKVEE